MALRLALEVILVMSGMSLFGRTRSYSRNHGFSLIEILITVLVLSIGLLGVAAMHLTSLRAATSSYQTSIASSAALDFEERLWIAAAGQPNGCLTSAEVLAASADWRTVWVGGVDRVSLPPPPEGLQTISVGAERSIGGGIAVEFPLELRWGDGRFADGPDVFHYTARVVCAPALPPTENEEET